LTKSSLILERSSDGTIEAGLDSALLKNFTFGYILIGCCLLFCVLLNLSSKQVTAGMSQTLYAYKLMTRSELSDIAAGYSARKQQLLDTIFDDLAMISVCSYPNSTLDNSSKAKNCKPQASLGLDKKFSSCRIRQDKTFAHSSLFCFAAALTAVLTLILIITTFFELAWTQEVLRSFRFYADLNRLFSDASDYYLYHSVYMIYGNFIKIDGEFASDK